MSELIELILRNPKVVITVSHANCLKVQTKPLVIYRDKEVRVAEIARKVGELADATVIINNSLTDMNKRHNFFKFDKRNKENFFKEIKKRKPSLVLDLHGMADVGPIFNSPIVDGYRYFRLMQERKFISKRPEIDIECRRKAGDVTATASLTLGLGQLLAKAGFLVDFEAVYPGGYLIQELSSSACQAMSIEIARRVRDDAEKRRRLIVTLANFIKLYLGKEVEEIIETSVFPDTEEMFKKFKDMVKGKREERTGLDYIG